MPVSFSRSHKASHPGEEEGEERRNPNPSASPIPFLPSSTTAAIFLPTCPDAATAHHQSSSATHLVVPSVSSAQVGDCVGLPVRGTAVVCGFLLPKGEELGPASPQTRALVGLNCGFLPGRLTTTRQEPLTESQM